LALQALQIMRQHLDQTALVQSERQQLTSNAKECYHLDAYLAVALHNKTKATALAAPVLAWKGAVFTRQRQQRLLHQLVRQDQDAEVVRLAGRLQAVTRHLGTLALQTPPPKFRKERLRLLTELTEEKEQLEADLAKRSGAFGRERQRRKLAADQLQK